MSQPPAFSTAEPVAVLKKYLCEKLSVSDLCDQHPIHVNTFSNWLKVYFENGTAAS